LCRGRLARECRGHLALDWLCFFILATEFTEHSEGPKLFRISSFVLRISGRSPAIGFVLCRGRPARKCRGHLALDWLCFVRSTAS
jgi:hypothetical protein